MLMMVFLFLLLRFLSFFLLFEVFLEAVIPRQTESHDTILCFVLSPLVNYLFLNIELHGRKNMSLNVHDGFLISSSSSSPLLSLFKSSYP